MTPDPRGAARAHPLTSRAPQSGNPSSRCAGFRPSLDGSRDGSPPRTPWCAGSGARRRGCAGKPAQALLGFRARDARRARTAAHGSFEDAPAPVHAPRLRRTRESPRTLQRRPDAGGAAAPSTPASALIAHDVRARKPTATHGNVGTTRIWTVEVRGRRGYPGAASSLHSFFREIASPTARIHASSCSDITPRPAASRDSFTCAAFAGPVATMSIDGCDRQNR